MTHTEASLDCLAEVQRARKKHGPSTFNSIHEGFGVLAEEVDELWEEVKKNPPSKELLRKEAIQVGAMAIRFAAELDTMKTFEEKL